MPKQTIEVDVPEGYEAVGYRPACTGEILLAQEGLRAATHTTSDPWLILRRKEPVRESRWGWVCCTHESLESARETGGCTANAIVRVDLEDGKLVGVALEEVT